VIEPVAGLAGVVHWLVTPISGSDHHVIDPRIAWHARAMVLAWSVLLPLGALVARFLKIVPGQDWPRELDRRTWWNAHRVLQYSGVAISLGGVVLAWRATTYADAWRSAHVILGWLLTVAGLAQLVSSWLRGSTGGPGAASSTVPDGATTGDHYTMTPRRILFERFHKTIGWVAVAVALVTTVLGLLTVDAPRWMVLVVGAWWALLVSAFVVLQRAGWCADTYQAIWGPSPVHPGNRRPPVGLGIRRGEAIGQIRDKGPK
jgi:hypothetical protein